MGWEERSDGGNDSDDTVCRNSVKDTPQSLPSRSHTAPIQLRALETYVKPKELITLVRILVRVSMGEYLVPTDLVSWEIWHTGSDLVCEI